MPSPAPSPNPIIFDEAKNILEQIIKDKEHNKKHPIKQFF